MSRPARPALAAGAVAACALAGALALLAAGCGGHAGEAERQPEPQVEVRVLPLETREFRDRVAATGVWKSANEVLLRAPAAGEIETLTPHAGDELPAGRAVGAIVTRESRAALEGARALEREATSERARAEAVRALALARRELVRVPLVAPAAGIVVRRSAEPGALVDDGAEILALVPKGGRVFEAHVPVAQVGRVHVGQEAEIGAAAPGGAAAGAGPALPAVVRNVLPMVDSTDQAALVWLQPRALPAGPALDRFGSARIAVGPPRRALAAPDSAIVEDDVTGEKRLALVGQDGRAAWTRVTLGADEAGWVEIRSPALPPGTRVVVQGQRGLPDRARLTIAR